MWTIWGTAVLMTGWVIVGLPLIGLGDRVLRIPAPVLASLGGLGGALLMLSPNIAARLMDPQVHYARFSIRDFAWPAVAFAIAAPTAALYRVFLMRARALETNVKETTTS